MEVLVSFFALAVLFQGLVIYLLKGQVKSVQATSDWRRDKWIQAEKQLRQIEALTEQQYSKWHEDTPAVERVRILLEVGERAL